MKKDFSVSKETKFTDTPAEAFISKGPETVRVDTKEIKQEPRVVTVQTDTVKPITSNEIIIAKYAPTKRERKTARLQLLVKQSFKDKLQKYCNEHDYSMNDLIESVLETYLDEAEKKL